MSEGEEGCLCVFKKWITEDLLVDEWNWGKWLYLKGWSVLSNNEKVLLLIFITMKVSTIDLRIEQGKEYMSALSFFFFFLNKNEI